MVHRRESESLATSKWLVCSVAIMRKALVGAAAISLTLALGGCALLPSDPPPTDPIAIGMRGSSLVVVPCQSIVAVKIFMSARGPNPPKDKWVDFFVAHGPIDVTAGELFSMRASAPKIPGTVTRFEPRLTNGTTLDFFFADKTGYHDVANQAFTLGSNGVPRKGWLQWDGKVTAKACGYKHQYYP